MSGCNLSVEVERFKKTIKKGKDILDKSLTKDTTIEVYAQAIFLGYLDASRTFKGQRKVKIDDLEIGIIAEEMKAYIDGNEKDFDSIFFKACKK